MLTQGQGIILVFIIFIIFLSYIYYNSRPEIYDLNTYIRNDDIENLKNLLNDGLDPNYYISEKFRNMCSESVLAPFIFSVQGPLFKSPLFESVKVKNWEIVDILLKHGAIDDSSNFKTYLENKLKYKVVIHPTDEEETPEKERIYYQVLMNKMFPNQ